MLQPLAEQLQSLDLAVYNPVERDPLHLALRAFSRTPVGHDVVHGNPLADMKQGGDVDANVGHLFEDPVDCYPNSIAVTPASPTIPNGTPLQFTATGHLLGRHDR